jgi:hypothetical protein
LILEQDINYIISGLERSGTSMLMQILRAGEIPISHDNARPADESNPKGYYELAGGKIINKLIDGSFQITNHKGKFIKVTSFGLKYLPPGKYKIIYSERNIEEILDSMEKMIGEKDPDREETKMSFLKLNNMIKEYVKDREDMDILFINYNNILSDPKENIGKIIKFLNGPDSLLEKMIKTVDNKLYRQRRT